MASLSSVSEGFSRSVLYSRQKRLAAVAQVCNTPRLATSRGSETVSLLMRRLHTNLRHAVQKRALAGSQCLHACSHSRQAYMMRAKTTKQDTVQEICCLPATLSVQCLCPVRTTCFAIAGALSRAVYMPSALQAKTMIKQCEKHTDAPLRIGMPLGTSIGKDCVSRSSPYAAQKRHEALLDSTTQLSALRNSEGPARTVEHSPGGPHQSSATQLSYQ